MIDQENSDALISLTRTGTQKEIIDEQCMLGVMYDMDGYENPESDKKPFIGYGGVAMGCKIRHSDVTSEALCFTDKHKLIRGNYK